MAARYERGLFDPDAAPGDQPVRPHLWAIASDGDLEEGITARGVLARRHTSSSATSSCVWDDNHISIEGDTEIAFTEDVARRYEAYGWHVQRVDAAARRRPSTSPPLHAALEAAKAETDAPVVHRGCASIIAWPAPNAQNTGRRARLGARRRRGRGHQGDPRLRPGEDLRGRPTRSSRTPARSSTAARRRTPPGRSAFDAWRTANPERAALLDRHRRRRRCPRAGPTRCRVFAGRQGRRHPQGLRRGPPGARARRCPSCGAARPTSPRATTPPSRASRRSCPPTAQTKLSAARPVRPHAALRHPRARHGRDHERHRAARRHPRLRRHVPRLLRLHARRRPAGRAHAAAGRPTSGRTTRSASARTARPTSRSSTSPRCAPSRAWTSSARPTPTRPRSPGARSSSTTTRPAGLALTRQNLPDVRPYGRSRPRTAWPAAATCSPRRRSGTPDGCILIGTGSEVQLAVAAREHARGRRRRRPGSCRCRAVEWFAEQDEAYREWCCRPSVRARVASRPASRMGWREFVGDAGRIVCLEHYGACAADDVLPRVRAHRRGGRPPPPRRVPADRSPPESTSGDAAGDDHRSQETQAHDC